MGLFREDPIDVDGVQVAPKKLLDALLYRRSNWKKASEISRSSVSETLGEKDGRPCRYKSEMVDHYDTVLVSLQWRAQLPYIGDCRSHDCARRSQAVGLTPGGCDWPTV
jgi:hypothetical protein